MRSLLSNLEPPPPALPSNTTWSDYGWTRSSTSHARDAFSSSAFLAGTTHAADWPREGDRCSLCAPLSSRGTIGHTHRDRRRRENTPGPGGGSGNKLRLRRWGLLRRPGSPDRPESGGFDHRSGARRPGTGESATAGWPERLPAGEAALAVAGQL